MNWRDFDPEAPYQADPAPVSVTSTEVGPW
jgi:hypothetical protein